MLPAVVTRFRDLVPTPRAFGRKRTATGHKPSVCLIQKPCNGEPARAAHAQVVEDEGRTGSLDAVLQVPPKHTRGTPKLTRLKLNLARRADSPTGPP